MQNLDFVAIFGSSYLDTISDKQEQGIASYKVEKDGRIIDFLAGFQFTVVPGSS